MLLPIIADLIQSSLNRVFYELSIYFLLDTEYQYPSARDTSLSQTT